MDNNGKFNIMLYSETFSFISMIQESISELKDVNIVEYITNINALKEKYKSDIILLYYVEEFDNIANDEVINFLESVGGNFVAVCKNPTYGFELMKKGALALIIKNNFQTIHEKNSFVKSISYKIRDAYNIKQFMTKRKFDEYVYVPSNKIIAIGSSMGGTEAIIEVLKRLPKEVPPIVIVQHMSAVFTKMYAERIDGLCKVTVWEAKNGDKLKPGLVLLAPGDYQMRVVRKADGLYVECFKGERVSGHAPSADVLFESVAEVMGKDAIGVILTGMGSDGAKGLKKMHDAGAYVIGQDEKSCVVYGMPKVAYDIGAVDKQVTLTEIAQNILDKI